MKMYQLKIKKKMYTQLMASAGYRRSSAISYTCVHVWQ